MGKNSTNPIDESKIKLMCIIIYVHLHKEIRTYKKHMHYDPKECQTLKKPAPTVKGSTATVYFLIFNGPDLKRYITQKKGVKI